MDMPKSAPDEAAPAQSAADPVEKINQALSNIQEVLGLEGLSDDDKAPLQEVLAKLQSWAENMAQPEGAPQAPDASKPVMGSSIEAGGNPNARPY